MTQPNEEHGQEVPTVDLSAAVGAGEQTRPETTTEEVETAPSETTVDAEQTTSEVDDEIDSDVEDNLDVEEDSTEPEMQPDWIGEGKRIFVERIDEDNVEMLTLTQIEDEEGLVSTILDPTSVRELYDQLAEIIDDQNYESWVALGNSPDQYQPLDPEGEEHSTDNEDDDAGEEHDRSRWERMKDPANLGRLSGGLDAESPVKGLSWKLLIFVAFVGFTLVLLALSGLS